MNAKPRILTALATLIAALLLFQGRADITTGLVGYWTFSEGSGSAAADSSGLGNNGTLTQFADTDFTTMWTPDAWFDHAILFNQNGETTNYVSIPNAPSLNFDTASGGGRKFTLAAWVRLDATDGTTNTIIAKGQNVNSLNYLLDHTASNTKNGAYRFHFKMRNSGNTGGTELYSSSAPKAGVWYHVVATYDTSTRPTSIIYINGVRDGDSGGDSLTTLYTTTKPVTIGNRQRGNGGAYDAPFKGDIDEVRIYSRALPATDVAELYAHNAYGSAHLPVITTQPRDVTCYSNDTAVFTGAAVTTNSYVPLFYQWLKEGSPIDGATTASLTLPNVTNANAGAYSLVFSNYAGSVTSSPAVLAVNPLPAVNTTSGLVGWWKMDDALGSSAAADSAGSNPGTLLYFSDPYFEAMWDGGMVDGALYFNGDGTGMNVVAVPNVDSPAPAALDFSSSPVFSVSVWVSGTVGAQSSGIIAKGTGGGGEQYCVEINNGYYRFFVRDASGTTYFATSTVPPTGVWQHLVATLDANHGTMNLYVNGALAASAVAPTSLLANSHEVSIGNRQSGSAAYDRPLTGAIDDLRVYSRALTAADVYALYAENGFPVIVTQYPVVYTNRFVLYAGSSPTFRVTGVTGIPPFSYQWYLNGVAAPDGTNSSYSFQNLPAGAGLTNYCVVTNLYGVTTSFVWTASVVARPTSPYAQSVLGLGALGYWRLDEVPDGSGSWAPVAHDYLQGNNGVYHNGMPGQSGYGQGLANQHGYYPPTDEEASALFGYYYSQDSYAGGIKGVDFGSPNGTTTNFTVECWVSGAGTQPSSATILSKGIYSMNDAWSFSVDATSARKYRFSVRTANGTVITATSSRGADIGSWHHLVGVLDEANGVVSFYIDGLLAATNSVGTTAGAYNSLANDMAIGSCQNNTRTGPYSLQFNGNVNDVAVYNYALSAGQVLSHFYSAGIGPRFTQAPPTKASATEPQTLTIATAAYGTPPLTYLWMDAMGSPLLADQTNATLVISNVPAELNGDYLYLTVTGPYGTLYAGPIPLTVTWGPPQVTAVTMPAHVYVPVGKSYTYAVSATGTVPFGYQWYDGGSLVPNETNASYVAAAPALGTRTVSVTVNNSRGSASASSLLTAVAAPSDSYAAYVLGMQPAPAGYWPLQEVGTSASVTMETNRGTLGALGNAYYAMNVKSSPRVKFGQPGALAYSDDYDPSVAFTGPSGTNYAFVPQSTSDLTIRPPFTVEAWVNSSYNSYADILGQGGNGTNSAVNSGNAGGFRLYYGGDSAAGAANLALYLYTGDGLTRPNVSTTNNPISFGAWHHCVASFDGTTAVVYVDGQRLNEKEMTMAVDTWSPLTIGEGFWMSAATGPNRPFSGSIDEVAVYTNVLSDERVLDHFMAGMNPTASNYVSAVLYDSPTLYYRMNAAGFIAGDANLCPLALNYGSAGSYGGVYQGGVVPGGVPGPAFIGLSSSVAAPINGVISCVDAGNDPSFNAIGDQPFTALVWFKANPADARLQGLMTHGNNWALNLDGTTGKLQFTPNNSTTLTTPDILNDGHWHLAAGVYDGATAYLYVDGALSVYRTATGSAAGDPAAHLFLGGNANYTSIGINQRYFDGAVAQAAFFTNALSALDIQNIYNTAVPTPTIGIEYVGGNVVITYTGTLLSAPTADGAYTPVEGASSPYTAPQGEAQRFYRSRMP